MLTTQKGHELPSFSFLAAPGATNWRVVTLDLRVPYVFISYAIKEGRSWLSQTSIFWRHEDVLDFCKEVSGDKSRKILNISLLRPEGQGAARTGNWEWAIVKEIFSGQFEDSGLHFPLYVTEDGKRFGGLNLGSNEAQKALERVFPTTKRPNKRKAPD